MMLTVFFIPRLRQWTYYFLVATQFLVALESCKGVDNQPVERKSETLNTNSIGRPILDIGENIDCIYQDTFGNYWFASNGAGVFRYDGNSLRQFTTKDGLCSDYVWSIHPDVNGNLWLTTRDGICRFDGNKFTDYTNLLKFATPGKLQLTTSGLFFNRSDDIAYFDGSTFTTFSIQSESAPPSNYDNNRPYCIYSSLVDNTGIAWLGTQSKGVCRYDGRTISYLTEKNLAGPAVRTIFQDHAGILWFGNNGGGLYRYDGRTLRNITEERGLGNPEFKNGNPHADKPGSLARVWAINEDKNRNLWVGTIDAGVWKYDGTTLTNYTTKDGLAGNSIWAIYKDKQDELLFITDGNAVCKFDGKKFTKVDFRRPSDKPVLNGPTK